jgi:hypothetical protein
MANPHHRAKHKAYVHQKHIMQKHHHHEQTVPVKSVKKTVIPLAIAGAIAGLLIGYIANKESIVVLLSSTVIGAFAGYLFGNSVHRTLMKKK